MVEETRREVQAILSDEAQEDVRLATYDLTAPSVSKAIDSMDRQTLLAPLHKVHPLDDSFTPTLENLLGRSTVVGNVESRFPWKESLGK